MSAGDPLKEALLAFFDADQRVRATTKLYLEAQQESSVRYWKQQLDAATELRETCRAEVAKLHPDQPIIKEAA